MKPAQGAALRVSGSALALACLASCGAPAPDTTDLVAPVFRAGGLSPLEARGARLFAARCATCHGATGAGDGQNAFNLAPPPPDLGASALSDTDRRTLIVSGSAALERSPLCPPRGRALAPDDVDAVVAFLGALTRSRAAAPQPEPAGRPRRGRRSVRVR